MPAAKGGMHILFEARGVAVDDIAPAGAFVHDDDGRFHEILGLELAD